MHIGGQPSDLLGQAGVLRKKCEVLFGEHTFAREDLGLASLERLLTLNLGIVVLLCGDVAELVALGLKRLRQKDERRNVRGLCR